MAKTKTQQPPQIELRNVDDFEIEAGYNVRDPKAFKQNVKEIASLITAGGLDSSQPIQYIVKKDADGNERNYVRNHTRFDALKSLGIERGYFVRVDRDETRDIVSLVTENAGHPLSRYEQGAVYVRLRDGTKDADSLPVGSEVRAPMSVKEIADAVGYVGQHVSDCIAIFEAPEPIRAMIDDGKVSGNAYVLARKNVKADGTVEKILRAAVANAKAEGKDKATEKHVKAVKDQFVETKKQKAVTTDEQKNGKSEPSNESAHEPEKKESAESVASIGQVQQPEMQLSGESNTNKKGDTEKMRRETLTAIVNKWSEEQDVALTDEDIDALLNALLKSSVPF